MSSILTALWSYLSFSEKIIVIVSIVFMAHGMCVRIYSFLEPHTQSVSKLCTDIKWSLEQLWRPLMWMRRICGARMAAPALEMPGPPLAMPPFPQVAARAPLAMPAWPPQVAPRAQAGARTRSPYRTR
jgi:hypothetical protein